MNKKYSRYNTLLRVNDRFGLFYNAMSDKFIVLKTLAYDALRQIINIKNRNIMNKNRIEGFLVSLETDVILKAD